MLEQYFVLPDTIDRIRSSWIADEIERYVTWLTQEGYAARTVCRRVPVLTRFGEFAKQRGAETADALPDHIEAFVSDWVAERCCRNASEEHRRQTAKEVRTPVQQMLRVVLTGFQGRGRSQQPENPFGSQAPGFFRYLREERGLREASIRHYEHYLRAFAKYLKRVGLDDLAALSPPLLSSFVTEFGQKVAWASVRNACGVLRVLVRYLHREGVLTCDLSASVEAPQAYRLSHLPRAIAWEDVRRMLEAVDQRTPAGKRDYAILLLLVTYGLRAREVAALTLDDIDWRNERLRIPERKAGHSTAYPLSVAVGQAILDYVKHARPQTNDRHVFFRVVAPRTPLTHSAISGRASHYLRKAGIPVARPGSHTLRHTCVQRLVDAQFSLKVIGDYVGHGASNSTEIYAKVDVEALREVACGDGEGIL